MRISKGALAIRLSRLKRYGNPGNGDLKQKVRDEQYSIDSEMAAGILGEAFQTDDIKDKVIADLGCGTGILGIGALILGAEKVFFVEKDKEAIEIAKDNLKSERQYWLLNSSCKEEMTKKAEFYEQNIDKFNKKANTVIMNPPFGTKNRHADREFLKIACKIGDVVYSLHKSETLSYIKGFLEKEKFKITRVIGFKFPLKASQKHHKSRIYRFDVSFIRAAVVG